MKKKCFLLILILVSGGFVGCNEQKKIEPGALATASTSLVSAAPFQANTVSVVATASTQPKLSPLENAQKDYLSSYDEYVRLLRESGPQTIETLQALAKYQKSYQLYQMLLRAEKSDQ